MLVMVDERQLVVAGYRQGFEAEGVALAGFDGADFLGWIGSAPDHEIAAVEAFLLGDSESPGACARCAPAPP